MTTVANERGLAMLLQASRDFALKQLSEIGRASCRERV